MQVNGRGGERQATQRATIGRQLLSLTATHSPELFQGVVVRLDFQALTGRLLYSQNGVWALFERGC